MNKREYGLHVFIESLYNDIRESYSKNIQENFVLYSPVFCPNTGEYGAKNPYLRWFYVVIVQPFAIFRKLLVMIPYTQNHPHLIILSQKINTNTKSPRLLTQLIL